MKRLKLLRRVIRSTRLDSPLIANEALPGRSEFSPDELAAISRRVGQLR